MTGKERKAWDKVAMALVWLSPGDVISQQRTAAAIEDASVAIDELLADGPDDKPKVDSSLRGWVVVNEDTVWWASEHGLSEERVFAYADHAWNDIPGNWTLRPLTPADVDGYSEEEIYEGCNRMDGLYGLSTAVTLVTKIHDMRRKA